MGTWSTDRTIWFPRLEQEAWGWEELADSAGGTFDVDLDGWIALARPWLDRMGLAPS